MELNDATLEEVRECLEYINDVGPLSSIVDSIMEGGQPYHEWSTSGDDFAGMVWHLQTLYKIFGIETNIIERYRKQREDKHGVDSRT